MKKKEKMVLQNMNNIELTKVIREAQVKLADWSVNRYSKHSKNVRESKAIRLKIAIAQTIVRTKELVHE